MLLHAMTPSKPPNPVSTFTSALQVIANHTKTPTLSTGSQRLDKLLGGVEPAKFLLFYSTRKDNVSDRLLYRLIVEAVKDPTAHVVYMLCGNYRYDRTTLDSEMLLNLLEASGLCVEDALSRIHIICAFSEAQLMRAPSLVEEVIAEVGSVRLLAVQQLSKLFYGESAVGFMDRNEFTGVVSKLKELCMVHQIALVATCEAKKRRGLSPEPMGGSYLRHTANVMVFLRMLSGGDVSAQLVKHYDKERMGKRVRLDGEEVEVLGRITRDSMRGRIQESMRLLRGGYREALKDDLMQKAFDVVWMEWNLEMGAMIYAQVVSALDLLNLTGVVANRRELESLRRRVEELEKKR